MYIVGQERRLVNPPSQVVAGVRTVTTKMNGRDALPRMSRPFAFSVNLPPLSRYSNHLAAGLDIGPKRFDGPESAGGK